MQNNYPDGTWSGDPRAPWNEPDPPECLQCYAQLCEDWSFCPYCGEAIEWDKYESEAHR